MADRVLIYDMGGKRIRAAVADRDGLIYSERRDIPGRCNNNRLNKMGIELGDKVLKASSTKIKDIVGIGFGSAGEWDGLLIKFSPNHPVRHNISVPQHLRDHYQKPTKGGNDLRVAVHAVPLYGHGRGKDLEVVCAITYSDGNNIAILNKGEPYPGYSDLSQEVGHVHFEHGPNARLCGCGARGCFEAYVSGTGTANMAKERLMALDMTRLAEQPIYQIAKEDLEAKARGELSSEEVIMGVKAEHVYGALRLYRDAFAKEICQIQRYAIAEQLAHVSLHHRPQLIELFGGLTNQDVLLFNPAILRLYEQPAEHANPTFVPPEIKITNLGDDIGLLGAAGMVYLAKDAGKLK